MVGYYSELSVYDGVELGYRWRTGGMGGIVLDPIDRSRYHDVPLAIGLLFDEEERVNDR